MRKGTTEEKKSKQEKRKIDRRRNEIIDTVECEMESMEMVSESTCAFAYIHHDGPTTAERATP